MTSPVGNKGTNLVWLRDGENKTDHPAYLLQEDNDTQTIFVKWATTGQKECIPRERYKIKTELPSRRCSTGDKRPFRYAPPTTDDDGHDKKARKKTKRPKAEATQTRPQIAKKAPGTPPPPPPPSLLVGTGSPPPSLVVTPPSQTKKENALDGVVKSFTGDFPYKGTRVAKFFRDTLYYGVVIGCYLDMENTHVLVPHSKRSKKANEIVPSYLWHVKYSDGDEEDLDWRGLHEALDLFKVKQDKNLLKIKNKPKTFFSKNKEYWPVKSVLERREKKKYGNVYTAEYKVEWEGWTDPVTGDSCTWVPPENFSRGLLEYAWEKFPCPWPVETQEVGEKPLD